MKALLSKVIGGPETLVLEDLPSPTPKAGQAVVSVKAVGVNYPDVLIIEDKYQFRPPRPFAPGAGGARWRRWKASPRRSGSPAR